MLRPLHVMFLSGSRTASFSAAAPVPASHTARQQRSSACTLAACRQTAIGRPLALWRKRRGVALQRRCRLRQRPFAAARACRCRETSSGFVFRVKCLANPGASGGGRAGRLRHVDVLHGGGEGVAHEGRRAGLRPRRMHVPHLRNRLPWALVVLARLQEKEVTMKQHLRLIAHGMVPSTGVIVLSGLL